MSASAFRSSKCCLYLLSLALLLSLAPACSSGGNSSKSTPTAAASGVPSTVESTVGAATPSTPGPATAAATPSGTPASGQASAWPTYDRDAQRTAVDPTAPEIGKPTKDWTSPQLDGDLYGQPLVVGKRVYVATEGNSVYALDVGSGKVVWRRTFGKPVPQSALPCGDIDPTGITGTPVIDLSTGLIYAVAFIQPGHHELYALDDKTGAVKFHLSADPPGANPLIEQQRSALTISQGRVYVAYGGLFGDCGPYHGWVVGLPANGQGKPVSYQVPSGQRAAIWAPPGPVVDQNGDLWVVTGNSNSESTFDYGQAVMRLSSDLKLQDWFAPSNWVALNQSDRDLGSSPVALLNNELVFAIGKGGTGYLLKADRLGHVGGQVFQAQVCGGAYGGTAYVPPMLYVSCNDGIVALKIGPGQRFSVAWRGVNAIAGAPIVAGGAVWFIDTGEGRLYALDAHDGSVKFDQPVGQVMHFVGPSSAGGKVFVPAGKQVVAFSLR